MTHPFAEYPLPWHDPLLQALLAGVALELLDRRDLIEFARSVPLDVTKINLNGTPRQTARSLIEVAARADRMTAMLDAIAERSPALGKSIAEWRGPTPVRPAEEPADSTSWRGFSDDGGRERQIVDGHPTLLDVAFFEQGTRRAASVCRLRVTIGAKKFVGTGFRVAPDLILTNHHVVVTDLGAGDTGASEVTAWFDYEIDVDGVPKAPVEIRCEAPYVAAGAERDWAIVRAVDPIPERFPVLSISSPGDVAADDRVYIIQHPGGRPKMIGMHHNLVRHVDDDVIQYWTDTEGGSSGSPVFDSSWNVVALHHRWTTADVEGRDEFRNQGQRIDRVRSEIAAHGVTLVD